MRTHVPCQPSCHRCLSHPGGSGRPNDEVHTACMSACWHNCGCRNARTPNRSAESTLCAISDNSGTIRDLQRPDPRTLAAAAAAIAANAAEAALAVGPASGDGEQGTSSVQAPGHLRLNSQAPEHLLLNSQTPQHLCLNSLAATAQPARTDPGTSTPSHSGGPGGSPSWCNRALWRSPTSIRRGRSPTPSPVPVRYGRLICGITTPWHVNKNFPCHSWSQVKCHYATNWTNNNEMPGAAMRRAQNAPVRCLPALQCTTTFPPCDNMSSVSSSTSSNAWRPQSSFTSTHK